MAIATEAECEVIAITQDVTTDIALDVVCIFHVVSVGENSILRFHNAHGICRGRP
jgi:hypothetical protein